MNIYAEIFRLFACILGGWLFVYLWVVGGFRLSNWLAKRLIVWRLSMTQISFLRILGIACCCLGLCFAAVGGQHLLPQFAAGGLILVWLGQLGMESASKAKADLKGTANNKAKETIL